MPGYLPMYCTQPETVEYSKVAVLTGIHTIAVLPRYLVRVLLAATNDFPACLFYYDVNRIGIPCL